MPFQTLAKRARLVLPLAMLALMALACNLAPEQSKATNTPESTGQTVVAQSDVPEVEIRTPADQSEVIILNEVPVYVRAVDRIGVTRIEMRVNNQLVDTAASPEANGVPTLDSILSWTPSAPGQNVIQVVAFRGSTRGNPKTITLIVRSSAAQVTQPAGSAVYLTASPTTDPTCRIRVNVDGLNLRSGPGTNYGIISNLSIGATFPVTASNYDRSWWQIYATGFTGWVNANSAYTTQFGVCSTVLVVQAPPSPTVPFGATAIVMLPTFTPFPTLMLPTPSSTIPVVVLPTLTATVRGPQGPASIGDLTSTAIYATQTQLAKPPTPLPTNTPSPTTAPGITPTIAPTATTTLTPTITPTPLLPNLTITDVKPVSGATIILDSVTHRATVLFTVTIKNTGLAPAPVFQVTIRLLDGTSISQMTQVVVDPGAEVKLEFDVVFKSEGPQQVTILADSGNVVVESDETDNKATVDVTAVMATVQGATATMTPTITVTPSPTVTPTASNTSTLEPTIPTETPTATHTSTTTETPQPGAPTETPTSTSTNTETPKPGVPTETPTSTTTSTVESTTPQPALTAAGFCSPERVATFTITNNGGGMSAEAAYIVMDSKNQPVSNGMFKLEAGQSTTVQVQGVSGALTLQIPQYQINAPTNCAELPTPTATFTTTPTSAPQPALTAAGVCSLDRVATFTITNNGGAMSAEVAYVVVNSQNQAVANGMIKLEAGQSTTVQVQNVSGALTLQIPQYQISAQTTCAEPPTPQPALTAAGICSPDRVATFTITNSGGAMSAEADYVVMDSKNQPVANGKIKLEAGQSTTVQVQNVSGALTLQIPQYQINAPTACAEPPTPQPALTAAGVCSPERVATFTITNSGGAMSAEADYVVMDSKNQPVANGKIKLEAGQSTTVQVQNVSGALTLQIPQYQVNTPTACAEPPTPQPALTAAGVCSPERVATFTITNSGGAMSAEADYVVMDSKNQPVANGKIKLEAGQSTTVQVQNVSGALTLQIPQYQISAQTTCAEPPTPQPALTAAGVCSPERVATFTITNSGGAMSAEADYVVINGQNQAVANGKIKLEAGQSSTVQVQNISGALTLQIPQYQINAQTACAEPPTPEPALTAAGVCSPERVATFTITNGGGAMSAETQYVVIDNKNQAVTNGALKLETGQNTTVEVKNISGVLTLQIPQYKVSAETTCAEPPVAVQPTIAPPPTNNVNLADVPVVPNLKSQKIRGQLLKIASIWRTAARPENEFTLVGDPTLLAILSLIEPGANLDKYQAEMQPIIDFFKPGLDGLQARYDACQGKSPLECPQAAAPFTFVSLGEQYMAGNRQPEELHTDLTNLVNGLTGQGIIPILVTIPGPIGDQRVDSYNQAIYQVADTLQVPLFNLYAIGAKKPNLLDNGKLRDPGPGLRADFTKADLESMGLSVALLDMLSTLQEVKNAVTAP